MPSLAGVNACSAAHLVTLNTQGKSRCFLALKAFLISNAVGFKPASNCFFHSSKPQLNAKRAVPQAWRKYCRGLISWI